MFLQQMLMLIKNWLQNNLQSPLTLTYSKPIQKKKFLNKSYYQTTASRFRILTSCPPFIFNLNFYPPSLCLTSDHPPQPHRMMDPTLSCMKITPLPSLIHPPIRLHIKQIHNIQILTPDHLWVITLNPLLSSKYKPLCQT